MQRPGVSDHNMWFSGSRVQSMRLGVQPIDSSDHSHPSTGDLQGQLVPLSTPCARSVVVPGRAPLLPFFTDATVHWSREVSSATVAGTTDFRSDD